MSILPKELIDQEVKSICSRYKVEQECAEMHINEIIQRHPKLIQKIQENSSSHITRLKAYKCFIKDVKKTIYYHLRQYHQHSANQSNLKDRLAAIDVHDNNPEKRNAIIKDLLASHISSKERQPFYDEFYKQLFNLIDSPKTIVDIGCGLHPLSYPFHKNKPLKTYLAIDKDASVIEQLQLYAPHVLPTNLKAVCMDIKDIVWSDFLEQGTQFDLAMMLKFIPVLNRQNKSSVTQLLKIPSKRIFLTGNIESMTRHENILRKEKKMLRHYIEMSSREVIASFQIDNEFGMLI
jgi:16S rRNA (guanine(1405)-N(7))-methyltransferase